MQATPNTQACDNSRTTSSGIYWMTVDFERDEIRWECRAADAAPGSWRTEEHSAPLVRRLYRPLVGPDRPETDGEAWSRLCARFHRDPGAFAAPRIDPTAEPRSVG